MVAGAEVVVRPVWALEQPRRVWAQVQAPGLGPRPLALLRQVPQALAPAWEQAPEQQAWVPGQRRRPIQPPWHQTMGLCHCHAVSRAISRTRPQKWNPLHQPMVLPPVPMQRGQAPWAGGPVRLAWAPGLVQGPQRRRVRLRACPCHEVDREAPRTRHPRSHHLHRQQPAEVQRWERVPWDVV